MDIKTLKNEIVDAVKVMFKSEFDVKVDEALKKGEEIKTEFALEEGDLAKITEMITEMVAPLEAKIAEMTGEAEASAAEGEEMKKELEEVKASKVELETKLAAEPIETPTKVVPSELKELEINLSETATSQTRLEAEYAKLFK